MSADLRSGHIPAPQSLNRYSYTGGDPINLQDPLGLEPLTCAPGYTRIYNGHGPGYCVADPELWVPPPDQRAPDKNGGGPDRKLQALKALLNPECAALFGGLQNALNALAGTTYVDYKAGMENPDSSAISTYAWLTTIVAFKISGTAAHTLHNVGGGTPTGITFLGPHFYELAPGFGAAGSADNPQMTIVMHELEHVALHSQVADQSMDADASAYSANYEEINQKCQPKDIPVDQAPDITYIAPN